MWTDSDILVILVKAASKCQPVVLILDVNEVSSVPEQGCVCRASLGRETQFCSPPDPL